MPVRVQDRCRQEATLVGLTGPAEAIFYWSGLYENILCGDLNEESVCAVSTQGLCPRQSWGSGGMLPPENFRFLDSQECNFKIFCHIIQCYFARNLSKTNHICAHTNGMQSYAQVNSHFRFKNFSTAHKHLSNITRSRRNYRTSHDPSQKIAIVMCTDLRPRFFTPR